MSDHTRPITHLDEALEEIRRLRTELAGLQAKYDALERRAFGTLAPGSPEAAAGPPSDAPSEVEDVAPGEGASADLLEPLDPSATPGDPLQRLERLRESITRAREQREQAVAEFHALVRPSRPDAGGLVALVPGDVPAVHEVASGPAAEPPAEPFSPDHPAAAAAIQESAAADHHTGVHTPSALRSLLFGTTDEGRAADDGVGQTDVEATPADVGRSGFRFGPVLVALLIPAVAFVLLGLWWRSAQEGPGRPPSTSPAAPASDHPPSTPTGPSPGQTSPSPADEAAPAPAPRVPVPVPEPGASASTSAPASAPQRLVIELTTTRPVWLRVVVDGDRRFERMIPPGERFMFEAAREVVVRAGDAGAVEVSVGGAPAAPLGGDGQVVSRTFTPGP
jgi:hypothetical protein